MGLGPAQPGPLGGLWSAYRLRLRRQMFLARAIRKRRELTRLHDRTAAIGKDDLLCFVTVRNEAVRLPYFLDHHRRLGVRHFLIVDNASSDGTVDLLRSAPDVSVWSTAYSYKRSRFGLDWRTWLMVRHGDGHWCLTLDADELLICPHHGTRDLPALTSWLDGQGIESFGTLMLDLYPQGPVGAQPYHAGDDPVDALPWYDHDTYRVQVQPKMGNLWLQGGPRGRCFFADDPRRAPTLNKTPLVRWSRRYAYVNSTHALLPPRLNAVYDTDAIARPTGVLLHTKFLNVIVDKSREEKERRQHFANSALYDRYYDAVIADPDLWHAGSQRFGGWQKLESDGLMTRGDWV